MVSTFFPRCLCFAHHAENPAKMPVVIVAITKTNTLISSIYTMRTKTKNTTWFRAEREKNKQSKFAKLTRINARTHSLNN